jgi:hypothetical protein
VNVAGSKPGTCRVITVIASDSMALAVARRPGGRKRSVRAGMEDYAGLAAMRGTLRRLQQLGDCLDSPSG